MRVLSANVAGINSTPKMHYFFSLAKRMNAMITFFQECKLKHEDLPFLKLKWGSDHVFLSSTDRPSRGVITMLHPSLQPEIIQTDICPRGQFIIITFRTSGTLYTVANVYGDPDTDQAALDTMTRIHNILNDIKTNLNPKIIIGGDFNTTLEARDSTGPQPKPRAANRLLQMITSLDLYDIQALTSHMPRHTYYQHNHEHIHSRLDRFYIPEDITQTSRFQLLSRLTDHHPILLDFDPLPRNSSWRFNDTLLEDQSFVAALHNTLASTIQRFTNHPPVALQHLQQNIDYQNHRSTDVLTQIITDVRKIAMSHMSTTAKERKEARENKFQALAHARQNLSENRQNPAFQQQYETAKESLRLHLTSAANAAEDRNTENYYTLGERVNGYHFRKSRSNKAGRNIPKLVVDHDGLQRTIEAAQVPHHMFTHYRETVAPNPEAGQLSIEQFLGPQLAATMPKCPPELHQRMTAPITVTEINKIIKNFKKDSAPGPLGISNLLLKEMGKYTLEILTKMGNDILFEDAPLPDKWFMHRKVILIRKANRDPLNPTSYRGISLLENIYKLYSTVIANRMKKATEHVQGEEQHGFTAGHSISEATRPMIDAMTHARMENKPLMILSTDFSTAFDAITFNHIENSLRFMEFPANFIKAFMKLVNNGTLQVEVNNNKSADYQILSGTGQGDPKSSYTFNCSVAPLNHLIANSQIVYSPFKPVFFADDNLIPLQGDRPQEILQLIRKIQQYEEVSGLSLNLKKCMFLPVNMTQQNIDHIVRETGMKKVQKIKHLGVIINSNGDVTYEDNILPIENAIRQIIQTLSTSASTPIGRSLFSRFLLASKYIHRLHCMSRTEHFTDLQKLITSQVWNRYTLSDGGQNYSRTHIAATRVSQPIFFGGLSVPDTLVQFHSSRFSWLRKMYRGHENRQWYQICNRLLAKIRRPTIKKHFQLGYHEWQLTGNKLQRAFPFWSSIFAAGASFQRLINDLDPVPALYPIAGWEGLSGLQLQGQLTYSNGAIREMIDKNVTTFGHLCVKDILGRTTLTLKTFEELEDEYAIALPILYRNQLTAMATKIQRRHPQTSPINHTLLTTMENFMESSKRSNHKLTSLLLRERRQGKIWPPSHLTYTRENITEITSKKFSKAMVEVHRSNLPPAVRWISHQVFLRTLWTKVKQSQRGGDDRCTNCNLHPERTAHLFFFCSAATNLYNQLKLHINSYLQEYASEEPIIIDLDTALFHQTTSGAHRGSIIHLLMVAKYTLYRTRFIIQTLPSTRFLILNMVLTLAKTLKLEPEQQMLNHVIQRMKSQIGLS